MDERRIKTFGELFAESGIPMDAKVAALRALPLAMPAKVIEVPVPERPTEEALKARVKSL